MLTEKLQEILDERAQKDALRSLHISEGLIDFCSNDYLGFAQKNQLVDSAHGSSGSRLISGQHRIHEEAEQHIAAFHQVEAALIFNSGYDANLSFFSCVPQKEDTVIYDQLCHASIRDGLRLGSARNFSFKHNDVEDLKQKLSKTQGTVFVVAESIYSMDGDPAPLAIIAQLCQEQGAHLIVDEAHSTGIFGEKGEGLCQELGIIPFARIHTFGKALGGHGAAIVGSQTLKDYLINFARPFIYTTALPPQSVAVIQQAYNELPNCPERNQLQQNIVLFKQLLQHPHLIVSDSPIQSIVIGGNKKTKDIAQGLQSKGLDVRPILHPTVAEGTERIRICLHSFNAQAEIALLCEQLKALL